MTSYSIISLQFDFYHVIYPIKPCDINIRRGNLVFEKKLNVQNVRKIWDFVESRLMGKPYALLNMVESTYNVNVMFIFSIFCCVRIEIDSYWWRIIAFVGQLKVYKSLSLATHDLSTFYE